MTLAPRLGNLRKINWTRSARTDRGVSAASMCVGVRLVLPRALPEMRAAINRCAAR
jgi:tRNA U38,U39,U40 pseudouridine synthase TruA